MVTLDCRWFVSRDGRRAAPRAAVQLAWWYPMVRYLSRN